MLINTSYYITLNEKAAEHLCPAASFRGLKPHLAETVRFELTCGCPQTDFEQLSHRLDLSLTIPNFRKFPAISDRFIAPSEKNARLMQGQRDGRSLLFAADCKIVPKLLYQSSNPFSSDQKK